MKRIIVLLLGILCTAAVSAQTNITEKFDGTSGLQWYEYSSKKSYAKQQGDRFELKSKNIISPAYTSVTFPVNPALDFTLRSTVVLPKLDKKTSFGIFFDEAENGNTILLLFSSQKFGLVKFPSFDKEDPMFSKMLLGMLVMFPTGKFSKLPDVEMADIKLKECKNARLNLEIKYYGGKYGISVNDMPIYEVSMTGMRTPALGFLTCDTMQIESFGIEQDSGY